MVVQCIHVEGCTLAHICLEPADCSISTCIHWHVYTRAHKHTVTLVRCTPRQGEFGRVMRARSETSDASLALVAAGAKGQERVARGCPRWGLGRGSAAEETEGAGRAGAARRGAAQLGRPLLVVRSSAPGPPALHHRSPAPVAWAWSPRHPLGTDSASPDPLREAELGQASSQRPGRHGKLPRPLPLAGPCLGPAAPWPNRCVRRRRAASEPSRPGRRRPSTLRSRNAGSPDEREGVGLQTFQEQKARPHFAV